MADKQSVLIICRSAVGQMYLGVLLNRIWFSPVLAHTTEEGIRLAPTMQFNLILLDGDIPEPELQASITALNSDPAFKDLPLVVIVTDDNPATTQSLFARGCSAVLIKPLDLRTLYGELQRLSRQPRQTPRVPVKLRVEIQEGTPEKTLNSVDISEGGIYLRTIAPLPEGSVIHLKFTLPLDTEVIEVAAKVVRTMPLVVQLNAEPGMGLSFVALPDKTRERIGNFVQWKLMGDLEWMPNI